MTRQARSRLIEALHCGVVSGVIGVALSGAATGGEVGALLSQGPIAACLEEHFDPERYLTDLEAAGWDALPPEAIPQAARFLGAAFLPLTHPPVPGRPDVGSVRHSAAQAAWEAELAVRPALLQGDSVLQLRGSTDADTGLQVLECWLLTPDIDFVEGLLARAETDEPVAPGAVVVATLEVEDLSDQTQLQVVVSRNPNPPGPAVGLITRLQITPAP